MFYFLERMFYFGFLYIGCKIVILVDKYYKFTERRSKKMPLYPLGFTLKDAYGRNTTRSFLLDDVTFAAAQVNANLFAIAYQDVTELQLTEARLTDVVTYAGAPQAGSNVDVGATFSVQLETPNKTAAVKVPGIIAGAINTDGSIDLAETAVAAYIAFYESGLVTASDGETVESFIKGTLDK